MYLVSWTSSNEWLLRSTPKKTKSIQQWIQDNHKIKISHSMCTINLFSSK